MVVFVDVLATPLNYSANYRYRIPKLFYGYAQFLWRRRVVQTVALEFANQVVFHDVNFAQQIAASLKCLQSEVNQSIANLGQYLGASSIITEGYQHSWPELLFDRIVFQLDPGWLIKVYTRGDEIERCDPDDAPSLPAPGAPSVPTPENGGQAGQNGLPEVSEPYDPGTNDDGDTYKPEPPDPGDDTYVPTPDPDGAYRCTYGGTLTGGNDPATGGNYIQIVIELYPGSQVNFDGPIGGYPDSYTVMSFVGPLKRTTTKPNDPGYGTRITEVGAGEAYGGYPFQLWYGWSLSCNSQ